MIYDCLNIKKYEKDELFTYYNKEYEENICSDGSNKKAKICSELLYKPIDSVIEVGCGEGIFLNEFINLTKPKIAVGTDISMPLLKTAQLNNPKLDFYRVDSKALPFKKKEFDLALLVDVLEHIKKPENSIKEASRVASQVLIKVPLEDNLFINLYKFFVKVDYKDIQGHIYQWNSKTFKRFIKENDLIIVKDHIPKATMVQQPNKKLWFMNVCQCIAEIFPDSIKTKLVPSEYYCLVEKI
jgi:ubiquinone/menaquinone biosynthesis C-methylase UbiE